MDFESSPKSGRNLFKKVSKVWSDKFKLKV